MLQILPESLRRKLDAEAERILAQIIQMINYSADIRMDYGQDRLSLSAVDSDELARRLFEYQLQEESLLNGVCGMKVRHGKDNESGTTSHHANPSLALAEPEAGENFGKVWWCQLGYSGSWSIQAERTGIGTKGLPQAGQIRRWRLLLAGLL